MSYQLRKVETVSEIMEFVPVAERGMKDTAYGGELRSECFVSFIAKAIHEGIGVAVWAYKDGVVVGGIMGVMIPDVFTGEPVFYEVFWYVVPEHRGIGGALFKRIEKWARSRGARKILMPYRSCSMPVSVKDLYEKRGYKAQETVYVKEWKE